MSNKINNPPFFLPSAAAAIPQKSNRSLSFNDEDMLTDNTSAMRRSLFAPSSSTPPKHGGMGSFEASMLRMGAGSATAKDEFDDSDDDVDMTDLSLKSPQKTVEKAANVFSRSVGSPDRRKSNGSSQNHPSTPERRSSSSSSASPGKRKERDEEGDNYIVKSYSKLGQSPLKRGKVPSNSPGGSSGGSSPSTPTKQSMKENSPSSSPGNSPGGKAPTTPTRRPSSAQQQVTPIKKMLNVVNEVLGEAETPEDIASFDGNQKITMKNGLDRLKNLSDTPIRKERATRAREVVEAIKKKTAPNTVAALKESEELRHIASTANKTASSAKHQPEGPGISAEIDVFHLKNQVHAPAGNKGKNKETRAIHYPKDKANSKPKGFLIPESETNRKHKGFHKLAGHPDEDAIRKIAVFNPETGVSCANWKTKFSSFFPDIFYPKDMTDEEIKKMLNERLLPIVKTQNVELCSVKNGNFHVVRCMGAGGLLVNTVYPLFKLITFDPDKAQPICKIGDTPYAYTPQTILKGAATLLKKGLVKSKVMHFYLDRSKEIIIDLGPYLGISEHLDRGVCFQFKKEDLKKYLTSSAEAGEERLVEAIISNLDMVEEAGDEKE